MGGFRPFTEYTCTVIANNSQGSGPPAIATTMTNEDGEHVQCGLLYFISRSENYGSGGRGRRG